MTARLPKKKTSDTKPPAQEAAPVEPAVEKVVAPVANASRYDDLTHDELVRLLQARDRRDATKFGLVWEANEIERDKAINADFVALDLVPEFSVGEAPWRNLIIEGDNFDALRYLRMTYAGQVKCIYIDPPYNTGNRDFVYNDRFVDANDSWRHSTWCEFMYQRLMLAKDLLRQDGVIFVSIDDNEIFTLGMLMEKVFGNNNFIANVIWQKRTSPDARIDLGPAHDYILVFGISASNVRLAKLPLTAEQKANYKNPDNDPIGSWVSTDYTAQGWRPNQMYTITTPAGVAYQPPEGRCWSNVESVYHQLVSEGRMWFGKDGTARPRVKTYLSEAEGIRSWTWWPNTEAGHNQEGKKEIMEILSGSGFDTFSTPKPVRLLERIIKLSTQSDDLILDFFAGSGTTAHAVLKLNAEDNGNRRFILVSNTEATPEEPEKNLCRDVCARRMQRVIEGYGDTPGLPGDFAYLRTRRIAPGDLLEIEHEQVWTALQMIHRDSLEPFQKGDFLWAGDEEQAILYVPRFKLAQVPAIRKQVKQSEEVVLYSWQPETLKQHVRSQHVQHAAIPESLARRFGMKG
jgi:adenine-specific DNA-methyltransferase